MAALNLKERVAALEAEVANLRKMAGRSRENDKPWWEYIYGSFANEPAHEHAMRLGREYRESLWPKPKKRRSNGRFRHRSS